MSVEERRSSPTMMNEWDAYDIDASTAGTDDLC